MNSLSGTTGDGCSIADIDGGSTNCVVEDEDSVCSGTFVDVNIRNVEEVDKEGIGDLRILQKLFNFRVILCFNLLLIHEIFLFALMLYDLETVAIEGVSIFVSGDVVDGYFLGDVWACVLVWLPIAWCQNAILS